MDITTATSDPDDCLVAGGKEEGGATHDFIYNGDEARSIDSKDSKFGTVTLELTSLTHCDPNGNMPPPGPPPGPSPAGKKYQCENACEPQTCYTCTAAATGAPLADCTDSCGDYSCVDHKCVKASDGKGGGQSLAACQKACK